LLNLKSSYEYTPENWLIRCSPQHGLIQDSSTYAMSVAISAPTDLRLVTSHADTSFYPFSGDTVMAGITTTSTLTPPVQQSFDYRLLSVKVPNMIHTLPAMRKKMPAHGGDTLRLRRYNPLDTAMVPLGHTGITPPPQQLTALNIDAKISWYGNGAVRIEYAAKA
jgi:hypothetical protein